MTRLWKGILVILGVLAIFLTFYLYIQYQRSGELTESRDRPAVTDTSGAWKSETKRDTSRGAPPPSEEPTPESDTSASTDTVREPSTESQKPAERSADAESPSVSAENFVVFDGTNFRPTPPEFEESGMEPIEIIFSTRMFDGKRARHLKTMGAEELPDKESVAQQARSAAEVNDIAVIDIEHWELNSKRTSVSEVEASIERYLTVLRWYQEAAPGVDFGYYGNVPIRSYWDAIAGPGSARYQDWMARNDRLSPLANEVDVLFPSLYTFYDKQDLWVKYAEGMIAEARRYNTGKPVYVFLWPKYHPYDESVAGKKIEGEFWRLQLETARKHADGVVIWADSNFIWNPDDAWWQVTKEFLGELKENS